jgi:hypothetical protein
MSDFDDPSLRALGHRMLDTMFDRLAAISEEPAWRAMPDAVRDSFDEPVPMRGEGAEAAFAAFVERVLPYPNGNIHSTRRRRSSSSRCSRGWRSSSACPAARAACS